MSEKPNNAPERESNTSTNSVAELSLSRFRLDAFSSPSSLKSESTNQSSGNQTADAQSNKLTTGDNQINQSSTDVQTLAGTRNDTTRQGNSEASEKVVAKGWGGRNVEDKTVGELVFDDPFKNLGGGDKSRQQPNPKDQLDNRGQVEKRDPEAGETLDRDGAAASSKGDAEKVVQPTKNAGDVLARAGDEPSRKEDSVEKDEKPDNPEKVKLDKFKFSETDAKEAVDLAIKHGLPISVYSGAAWCPKCPAQSANVDKIANEKAGSKHADAIVLKIDADAAQKLAGTGSPNGKVLGQLLSNLQKNGGKIPRVDTYDPKDLSKPADSHVIAGQSLDQVRTLIDADIAKVSNGKVEQSNPQDSKAQPEKPTGFNENNIVQAVEQAKNSSSPLLSFVNSGKTGDANMAKVVDYLSANNLAVAANINKPHVDAMRRSGIDSRAFKALESAINPVPGHEPSESVLNSFRPESITNDFKFNASISTNSKVPDDVVSVLKQSGVKLTDSNESAVRALLEGKPVPEPQAKEKPVESEQNEKIETKEKAQSIFKSKNAEDAQKVIELAKQMDLPLVVHSPTAICSNDSCTMQKLDSDVPRQLADKAIFLQIPRGGFPEESAGSKEIQAINEQFKVTEKDHKTELDIHVFSFDKNQNMTERRTDLKQGKGMRQYLSDLIK